ncbi:MAG: PPC domain-containing protein [Hyphomonadaceae bacterium]
MQTRLWLGAAAAALLTFGFSPAQAQDTDQPGDASTQARLDGTAEGEISPAGDVDWFRLHVERGQRYNFALVGLEDENGQALDPMLGIYDANGNQLAFNDDAEGSLNSALRFSPAQTGDVFVEARAFSDEATGRYRLGVASEALPPDDVGNDASTRARASAGRISSGNVEYEGDVDWYRFAARAGYRYHVTLSGAGEGGLADPVLRVLDRDGNELAGNDDSDGTLNSALDFISQSNRDVFIEARAYSDGYTGAYNLGITAERMPSDDAAASTSTRGRITVGQTVNSSLDFPSDQDWYRVRLEAGQSYRFTLRGAGTDALGDPLLRLYGANGQELATDDDGGDGLNSYLEFTAPEAGNYFVAASAFGDAATGGYALAALPGDIPADASTDASLSADGDYREGVLSPASDRDWYRIDLTEGQAFRLSMESASSGDALGDPYMVLYGPDGAEIARDDDGGEGLNAWLEYQAAASGAYFVEARGFSEQAEGRYVLTLTPGEVGSTPDSAEALQPNGDPRISMIGAEGDTDWFAIDMVEGRPYRFNLTGAEPGALADPYLTLYDSEGNQVAADDDGGTGVNAYLSYASPTGGPHFAAVSSFGDTGTGRYQLRVTDTDVPGSIYTDEFLDAAADDRTSSIEMPGDIDSYRVTLEAGASYEINVRGAGEHPLADPFVALVNDENTRLTSDDDSGPGLDARVRYRADATGDIVIQVSGLGGSTGTYQVQIVRR